jgi:hypothetical protein
LSDTQSGVPQARIERIHAALKQGALFEGSPGAFPGPTRPGCIFLVTPFVQAKEVTRHSGETGNCSARKDNRKQVPTDFGEISGLGALI